MISYCPDQASVYSLGIGSFSEIIFWASTNGSPRRGRRCSTNTQVDVLVASLRMIRGARLNGYVGKLPHRTCAPVATDAWSAHSRRAQAQAPKRCEAVPSRPALYCRGHSAASGRSKAFLAV